MKSIASLPEGYREILSVDLQKNKKLAILVNVIALVISIAMVVAARFAVPISSVFESDVGIIGGVKFFALLPMTVLYMVLHELVHGVAMKICGTKKVKYGFTGVYAFAGSDDYYGKGAYIFIALAPVVLWGAVLAALCAVVPIGWFWIVYIIQVLNISGAAGDFYVTCKFIVMPKDILVRDAGVSMKVYSYRGSEKATEIFDKEYINEQIKALGIPDGANVIIHTSLRSIGKIEGGAETLLDILVDNITSRGGLLCVPTHTWKNLGTDKITLDLTNPETNLGAFPTVALHDARGVRSHNPTHSMVVFGDRQKALDFIRGEENVKTPTSPIGCYGKLCAPNGYVLLVGVGHNRNTYLHSVEEMLEIPGRMDTTPTPVSTKFADGSVRNSELYMFDESIIRDISDKFYMYEPAFRANGAIKDGYVGSAPTQLCDCVKMKDTVALLASRAVARDPLLYDGEIPAELYDFS